MRLESSKPNSGRKTLNGGSLFANATSCPATGARTSCPSDPYQGSIQNPVSMHGYLYAKPAGAASMVVPVVVRAALEEAEGRAHHNLLLRKLLRGSLMKPFS